MSPPVEHYTLVDTVLAQALPRIDITRREDGVPPRLAYGRVSAEDVLAPADVPPCATSHWDGYAVASRDLRDAGESKPVRLRVIGSARLGSRPRLTIGHREALQVVTGATLPSGADAVVPVESVRSDGGYIAVNSPIEAGSHVYAAGGDMKKGETLLRKGQVIRAQDVGLLLALGVGRVRVRRKPRVAVLATGSELTAAGRKPGKVVNSHSPVFLRLCEVLGCVPVDMGIVGDNRARIAAKLQKALARSDFVLTLGGTSAGRHDHVTEAVGGMGPDMLAHGVKMDRGRVTGFSVVNGKPILMMPGPIQGAMNAFLLLGLPVIDVLSGAERRETEVPCTFAEPWAARDRYADFRKVVYVKMTAGSVKTARPLEAETESMKVLSEADGYVVVPENVARIGPGDRVLARLLPGLFIV